MLILLTNSPVPLTFALTFQFHGYLPWVSALLNVDALVGAFNQEKTLVGAFSVILKTDGLFAALRLYLHHSDQSRAERGRRESGVGRAKIITIKVTESFNFR